MPEKKERLNSSFYTFIYNSFRKHIFVQNSPDKVLLMSIIYTESILIKILHQNTYKLHETTMNANRKLHPCMGVRVIFMLGLVFPAISVL